MNLADEKKKAVSSPSTSVASPGPVVNQLDDIARETFATGRPLEDSPDLQQCKHCKKSILKTAAKAHIAQCLKLKKEKAQRKKEAREARERAKEAAREEEARKLDEENGDDDSDDDDKKGSVAGKKAGKKPEEEKKGGKKRKADGEPDKGPKAKKKKDEPKAKVPKPKGLNSNGSPLSRITSISCLTDLILQGRSMSKDNVVSYSPMDNLVLDRLRARATPWEQSVLSQVVPFPTICF
jgi:SAGA-associated factor 73